MSGPSPRCRLLRDLAAEDRLLMSPELRELRRCHAPDRLRAVLAATLEELAQEQGLRFLEPSRIDRNLLRTRLEQRLQPGRP